MMSPEPPAEPAMEKTNMKTSPLKNSIALTTSIGLLAVSNLSTATHYESLESTN
jgi:hypothetical protein